MDLAANALTTLGQVKAELGVTGGREDDYLHRLINAASSWIESYCQREFALDTSTVEQVAGYGRPFLVLSRTPLLSITSITYDGTAEDISDVEIHDAKAGIIFRPGGWVWTAQHQQGITYDVFPGTERKMFEVTYSGGYATPEQERAGSGTPVRTLPFDLEDACIRMLTARYREKGRNPNIKSEGALSWKATYSSGVPSGIDSTLRAYMRLASA